MRGLYERLCHVRTEIDPVDRELAETKSLVDTVGGADSTVPGIPESRAQVNFLCMRRLLKNLWVQASIAEATIDAPDVTVKRRARLVEELFYEKYKFHLIVSFEDFKFWYESSKGRGSKDLSSSQSVWTQIRTFIKGTVWSTMLGRPLTRREYVDRVSDEGSHTQLRIDSVLTDNWCRLDKEKRAEIFQIYEKYASWLSTEGKYDEMDQVLDITILLKRARARGDVPLLNKVYIDEVQDMTQAELAMCILANGVEARDLCFAGDNAQSITHGVAFQFEEIRTLIHLLAPGQDNPRKELLTKNFRSHSGILNVANSIVQFLCDNFKDSVQKVPFETGLAKGPRPSLLKKVDDEMLIKICAASPKLKILTWDEHSQELFNRLERKAIEMGYSSTELLADRVKGIREVKGLEYIDITIVDFFRHLGVNRWDSVGGTAGGGSNGDVDGGAGGGRAETYSLDRQQSEQFSKKIHKAWKSLFKKEEIRARVVDTPVEVEYQLKMLYTAVTRSCSHLIFAETESSIAGDAWFNFLKEKEYAVDHPKLTDTNVPLTGNSIMLPDDWLSQGIAQAANVEGNTSLLNAFQSFRSVLESFAHAGLSKQDGLLLKAQHELEARKLEGDLQAHPDEVVATRAVLEYLKSGNFDRALRLVGMWCKSYPSLSRFDSRIYKWLLNGS